ncbi:NAD-dependent epimerase/dehydratase family protein [Deinococcus misasensis]|uniref:NAD-dependent epimerase/dehydratase family protein n=1 Tax=Deinococcus misasensis TaxID=392413 RepID=UPI00054F1ED4|nr:NAD-dependent epimerase/dehydratase family protein [Deinococcus misasensis]
MNVLVLGGSRFVGWYIVHSLLKKGHQVSVFNRGRSNTDLPPEVEQLVGDRNTDLAALQGRTWDAVVDVNAYVPRQVRQIVEVLKGQVEHYMFISTVSVYASDAAIPLSEDSKLIELENPETEEVTGETYGGLKVLCERTLAALWGEKHTVIRPGLVVGARDLTFRFPFWAKRILEGGELIAPDKPVSRVQIVYARDLADFAVHALENRIYGTFNGAREPELWGEVLREMVKQAGTDTQLTWVDSEFLLTEGVRPWVDLPIWLPEQPEYAGMLSISDHKAKQYGMTSSPLPEVIADILQWAKTQPDEAFKEGLSRARIEEILQKWHTLHP